MLDDRILKEIHQQFPEFKRNLFEIMLRRKKIFIDSGLRESVRRIMKTIRNDFPDVTRKYPSELRCQSGLLEETPAQYVYSFLEFVREVEIAWAEQLCKAAEGSERDDVKWQKMFEAWALLMEQENAGNKQFIHSICASYDNMELRLKDVELRESKLKDIIGFYSYNASRPIDEDWSKMAKRVCEIMKYFEEGHKDDRTPAYWFEIDTISEVLQQSKNFEDIWESLGNRNFSNFKLLPLALREECNRYKEAQNLLHQAFSEATQRANDFDQIYLILMSYYKGRHEEKLCLNLVLHCSVFEFLLRLPSLSASNPHVKPVIEYFVDFLKLVLEVICYQSAFNRATYALRNDEIVDVVLNKLKLDKGDRFLDMFANIPVVSYCASLLGAKVCAIDCDFVETHRFTDSLRKMHMHQREFARHLRNTFGSPETALQKLSKVPYDELKHLYRLQSYVGGPFVQEEIHTPAVQVSLEFFSFFPKVVERNFPTFLVHRFSLDETFKDEDIIKRLEDNYFDKMLIDPPYGKETARDGFGPEQGLIVAKKGLQEASRLLKQGGRAVLTLPSYKRGWEQFKDMKWRETAISFAENYGFTPIDNRLPDGRSLALLQKQ